MSVYTFDVAATPPSLNTVGSRGHWRRWHRLKVQWQADIGSMLMVARVPRGLTSVKATAELRHPVRRVRDSDNHSALLAKSLGDALVGGWLEDDDAARYAFTPVTFDAELGPARTRVTLTVCEADR